MKSRFSVRHGGDDDPRLDALRDVYAYLLTEPGNAVKRVEVLR